jgi:hypothetical protein
VTVRADEVVLSSQRKFILTPGEMAVTTLSKGMLEQCRGKKSITLEISPEKKS